MSLVLNTAPAIEPISTADAKTHLRIDTSDDDAYIDAIVKAARVYAENFLRRALITQTWDLYLDAFPSVGISMPKAPIQSVSAITYVDTDGVTQTLASSVYTVDAYADPGKIILAYQQSFPSTRAVANAVKITFIAGYGSAVSDIPEQIIQGMKLLIGHLYENREQVIVGTSVSDLPMTIETLLRAYQVAVL